MDNFIIRTASQKDLPRIIELLADIVVSRDPLRYADEVISNPPMESYVEAFEEILSPPNLALVAVLESQIVGYTQVSFVPGLTRRGQKRAIVEDVRVDRKVRGHKKGNGKSQRASNKT